ncbi:Altered inheritance of mitochondria protein 6 [Cercospora zeina]
MAVMGNGTAKTRDLEESQSSTSSPILPVYYRDFDDDDDEASLDHCSAERSPRRSTVVDHVFSFLGMTSRQRRRSKDYDQYHCGLRNDVLVEEKLKPSPVMREGPRRRRTLAGSIRRGCLTLSVVVLMFFGILHILQAVVGRAHLLWNLEIDNISFPEWGLPGQSGEGLANYPTDATRDVLPIRCHSHNDYWRRVPLYDALHWGCTGVEADVWLFDEELYVGHNTAALTENRTFRNLYVNPIVELLDAMNPQSAFGNTTGHGVFDADPEQSLTLLVDFKTEGRETYPHVRSQLSALREKDYLSYHDGERFHKRAVTVVGTGNTPFDMVVGETDRREIFFDAPLDRMWEPERESDAQSLGIDQSIAFSNAGGQGTVGTGIVTSADDFNSTNSWYASVSFARTIGFVWAGQLSESQLNKIRGQIRGAKRRGLHVRYWDTPSWPVSVRNHVWDTLMREGADILNGDDLKGMAVENWRARVHGFW